MELNHYHRVASFFVFFSILVMRQPVSLASNVTITPVLHTACSATLVRAGMPHIVVVFDSPMGREFYKRRLNRLAHHYINGDPEARELLPKVIAGAIFSPVMREFSKIHDVEDVIQNVQLDIHQWLLSGGFDPKYPNANFYFLMYSRMEKEIRKFKTALRKQSRIVNEDPSSLLSVHAVNHSTRWQYRLVDHFDQIGISEVEKSLVLRDEAEILNHGINEAFKALTEMQREAVEFRLSGLQNDEIASILDLPLTTVQGRVSSGIKKLRENIWRTGATSQLYSVFLTYAEIPDASRWIRYNAENQR